MEVDRPQVCARGVVDSVPLPPHRSCIENQMHNEPTATKGQDHENKADDSIDDSENGCSRCWLDHAKELVEQSHDDRWCCW